MSKKIGLLFVGGQDHPFAKIACTKAIRDLDNKIIECTNENGQWKFMRERRDKTMPNSYSTACCMYYFSFRLLILTQL